MNTVNASSVWERSLAHLYNDKDTGTGFAKGFLSYLVPRELDERQLVLATHLLQIKQWNESRYLTYIKEAVFAVTGTPLEVVIVLDESVAGSVPATEASVVTAAAGMPSLQAPLPPAQPDFSTSQFSAVSGQNLAAGAGAGAGINTGSATAVGSAANSTTIGGNANVGSSISKIFVPDTTNQSPADESKSSKFTFTNYVVGDSNNLAYSASLRVAESPGEIFNPLFIYGRSGLGKTHLLLAINHYIQTYTPEKRVVYATTSEFVTDFTSAIAGDRDLTSFKRKYHTCDVLLIDDVQNLEGKESTTDALFEIFNLFIDHNKQIVLSADRSPAEINLDERFTSRFSQGVTADVQPPSYEMKAAILIKQRKYFCNSLNIPEVEFEDEAVQKIVYLSGSNIRSLEGAVSTIIYYYSRRLDNKSLSREQQLLPISLEDVDAALGNNFFPSNSRRVDIAMVMQAVEAYFKVTQADLVSDKRSKNISHPRQVAMYLIRRFTNMSYPEIGKSFKKDHSTAIYAEKNIQSKMAKEISIKVEVERIAEMLTS